MAAKFACPQCVLALESRPQWPFSIALVPGVPWYGRLRFSGSRICGYCGEKWLRRNIESDSVMPVPYTAETIVACPVCGREHPLELQAVRIHDNVRGCEPAFGIALALSEPVASGQYVWAYNREHLAALKSFIGATLRERGPDTNASLFSRLPAWFKSARNREKLTKAISRIEQRYGAME